MSSEKFVTINRFIETARSLRDLFMSLSGSDQSAEEVMQKDTAIRRDLVRAAQAVSLAEPDPEADRIIGAVLLQRIAAASGDSAEEWDKRAAEAHIASTGNTDEAHEKLKTWWDATQTIVDLGFEAMQRAEQQQHETMIEGLRRGAEQTPGFNLRITETVGDTVISDETVLGPEPGQEDADGHRVGRVSSSAEAILGIDDDRMETDVSHLLRGQFPLVLSRNRLFLHADSDEVRLTVSERLVGKINDDLDVVDVIGDLPSPIANIGPRHFPALRAQLLLQQNLPLTEGPVFSRANRGDPAAQGILMQAVVIGDMLAAADPYFLALSQIDTAVQDEDLLPLVPERSFLVWHDSALHVGKNVDILAWLFTSDERGNLHPVVHVIRTHPDGFLEASWCSLRQGPAARSAQQISRLLLGGRWETARPLRLPKPKGGKEWKKALVRSSARAKEGALHGLRTLPQ